MADCCIGLPHSGLPVFEIWDPSKVSLPLPARGEAHLWTLCLNAPGLDAGSLWKGLSAGEQDAAQSIGHPGRRREKVVSKAVLRRLLGAYLGLPGHVLRFVYSARGKPALDAPGRAGIHFNLSHSRETALFAFSADCEIGVDVEPLDRKYLPNDPSSLMRGKERAAWEQLDEAERPRALLAAWVRKEAMIKALGEGLSTPLGRFTPDGLDRVSGRSLAWAELAWPAGHLAAVAVVGELSCLRLGTVDASVEMDRVC